MPPRHRPTARLLTPAGWIGVAALAATAAAAAVTTLLARAPS